MGPKMIQLLKTDGAIYYCQKKKNQQLILLNQYEWGQQDSHDQIKVTNECCTKIFHTTKKNL